MFRVTQTWGRNDPSFGTQADEPKEFETLEDAGAFIESERAGDAEMGYDVIYQLFENSWKERSFTFGIKLTD